jgi:hypothetical protein
MHLKNVQENPKKGTKKMKKKVGLINGRIAFFMFILQSGKWKWTMGVYSQHTREWERA